MSARVTDRTYSIREVAGLTGLPASTLRYYESVGVVRPVSRGASSGHRVYTDEDLDLLTWVACLSHTGMSIEEMRRYVANGALGSDAAGEQIELLTTRLRGLELEESLVALRKRYVEVKIAYWQAVRADDDERVEELAGRARELAEQLTTIKKH